MKKIIPLLLLLLLLFTGAAAEEYAIYESTTMGYRIHLPGALEPAGQGLERPGTAR